MDSYKPVRPTLKGEQIGKLLQDGHIVMIGEYRGFKTEVIKWNDKSTGKPEAFLKCAVTIERADGESVECNIALPRGFPLQPELVDVGLKKGQHVALRLLSAQREKGRLRVTVGSEPEAIALCG